MKSLQIIASVFLLTLAACSPAPISYSAEALICSGGAASERCKDATVDGVFVISANPALQSCSIDFKKNGNFPAENSFSKSLTFIDDKNWQCTSPPDGNGFSHIATVTSGKLSITLVSQRPDFRPVSIDLRPN